MDSALIAMASRHALPGSGRALIIISDGRNIVLISLARCFISRLCLLGDDIYFAIASEQPMFTNDNVLCSSDGWQPYDACVLPRREPRAHDNDISICQPRLLSDAAGPEGVDMG